MEKPDFLDVLVLTEPFDLPDLCERAPPADFLALANSTWSRGSPHGLSFCISLQMCLMSEGFFSYIELHTTSSFSIIWASSKLAYLCLNLMCYLIFSSWAELKSIFSNYSCLKFIFCVKQTSLELSLCSINTIL